jgi:serine/threonine-protein kinase
MIASHARDDSYRIATVHAWSGDRDQAFAWLDRSVAQHESGVVIIKYDPLLRGIRDDPRYAALLDKLKLPQH